MNRIIYLQDLVLVQHNYTGVISYKDWLKLFNMNMPLTDKYFLLKYNGYIKAGVDFSSVNVDVLSPTDVHISIPKPKIMDIVIDENSIEVFNQSENAFNPIKIEDYKEALSREKDVMVKYAVEQGIYAQATEHAKIALSSLLRDMGFINIDITEEFKVPSPN